MPPLPLEEELCRDQGSPTRICPLDGLELRALCSRHLLLRTSSLKGWSRGASGCREGPLISVRTRELPSLCGPPGRDLSSTRRLYKGLAENPGKVLDTTFKLPVGRDYFCTRVPRMTECLPPPPPPLLGRPFKQNLTIFFSRCRECHSNYDLTCKTRRS